MLEIEKASEDYSKWLAGIEKLKKDFLTSRYRTVKRCKEMFEKITINYSSTELHAWNFFKEAFDTIPFDFTIKIMFDSIYNYYVVDYVDFLEYLSAALGDESYEARKQRADSIKKELEGKFDKDGYITVYRGTNILSNDERYAMSYSLDRKIAETFNTFACIQRVTFPTPGNIIEKKIHIDEIIYCINERDEQEVIVMPPVLKEELEQVGYYNSDYYYKI